ncbi:MAG: ATP-binding cassette domain-containing protein [Geminicoccaceae bacterium]|nr:ATP-binding cassette domain-containing protein [Geminicoccaceae bacterium]
MSGAIIEMTGLTKRFGALEAVRGIDLSIAPGGCIGLLGPNGAGKTTTMRMIMGLTRPSGGSLRVLGRQISAGNGSETLGLGREEKAKIGLVPQETNLDPDLSVVKNLEVYGRYFGVPPADLAHRVDRLLAFMQLEEKRHAPVMALSGGMKRRLIIARALIGEPELVVLDEPTTGLDPQARVLIWKQLLRLKAEGKTLLLTTHYMDEAERLCDRIVIIDGGRILDEGRPRELIRRHVARHVFEVPKPLPERLLDAGLDHEDIGDAILLYVERPEEVSDGLPDEGTYFHRPANLEDVFLRLTGRHLREAL